MPERSKQHHRAKVPFATVQAARYMREMRGKTYAAIGSFVGAPWLTVRDWCTYRTRISS